MSDRPGLVVCTVAGERESLSLPGSHVDDGRRSISGGERSLYELAVAGAVAGLDVELRGSLNGPILAELTDAAGVSPRVGLPPRRPGPGELVVVPEAADFELLAALFLSGARAVVYLLAPPGLWGWSFLDGWSAPGDPGSVAVDSVGLPESYRAIAGLGFAMWTNARGIAEAGRRAGVAVESLGTGTPVPFPAAPTKTADIAVVEANRWAPSAEELVRRLPEAIVHRIGAVDSVYSLSEALGPAHILPWPSRIEGMSRIAREARAVGTVPVALDTNPFATPDDHGEGVVLVPDLDAIVQETRGLLADRARLQELQRRAVAGVRTQADWPGFVGRVGALAARPARRGSDPARRRMGDELAQRDGARRHDAERLAEGYRSALAAVTAERDAARSERDAARSERDAARSERDAARSEREALDGELEAQRRRLATRVIDGSPLGAGWRAVRSRSRR